MTKYPIRILYTIPNFITAGSGQVLANIVQRLDKEKFEAAVCVVKKGGNIMYKLEASGIQVFESPFLVSAKPYIGLLNRSWEVAKAFKPFHFDLWHSFNYSDDYTEPFIAKLAGAKAWVYTKKSMMWGTRAWILKSLLASRIVADNPDMPTIFFNKFGLQSKTRVIQHGIPLEKYYPRKDVKNALREEFNIPEGDLLIGCVAHILPVKDHPTLIDAVAQLKHTHLFLAGYFGEESYLASLNKQILALGISDRVHFLGEIGNIPEFLKQIDVKVLPSKKEAFGVALIEAMACGLPVIASNISGPRDIIEDGKSGYLFPQGDSETLAYYIKKFQNDPELRVNMGFNARKRVEDRFSIEREVAAHETLYLECLNDLTTKNTKKRKNKAGCL